MMNEAAYLTRPEDRPQVEGFEVSRGPLRKQCVA